MRTGPLHQHGSARHNPHCSSLGAARRLSARITTICSSRQPRRNRPVRSNHCVRAESAGPNAIHCRATTSASRLADRNDARDCPTPDNSDWTTNMVPPSTAAPTPSRTTDPEPDARHRRRPGGGRNHLNTGVPAHRHLRRIADNDVQTARRPTRGVTRPGEGPHPPCWPRQSPPHRYRYTDLTHAARQDGGLGHGVDKKPRIITNHVAAHRRGRPQRSCPRNQ